MIFSKNVSSAIFLLEQKMDAIEFLYRIKAVALYFNELSEVELRALKHWIKNTTETPLAEIAIDILEANREDVEPMVASNAFVLKDDRDKAKRGGIEQGKVELLIKQLSKKIGKLPDETSKK